MEIKIDISLKNYVQQRRQQFHKNKKFLSYAVTHGLKVLIKVEETKDTITYRQTDSVHLLNLLFRSVPFFTFQIVDGTGTPYAIKKGRLKPCRQWRCNAKVLNKEPMNIGYGNRKN